MSTRESLAAALQPLIDRCYRGTCWKKTADGPRNLGVPFTAPMLSEHIVGASSYGLALITPGENTTRAAVLDLDSHKGEVPWADMLAAARQILDVLVLQGVHAHPFRSSGGKGVHLIMLWEEPQDAFSVRETLREALAACGLKNGTGGIAKGMVEIFPKQDAVPLDGFGNMFILPLAGESTPLTGPDLTRGDRNDMLPALWRMSDPVSLYAKPERVPASLQSTTYTQLQSALDAIPNSGTDELDYDQWRNVVFGIHHATDGSDEGLALAHAFSSRAAKYQPEFLDERVWPYIRSDRDDAITERSIIHLAGEHGWQDTSITDEFEVVDAPVAVSAAVPGSTEVAKALRYNFVQAAAFASRRAPPWIVRNVLPVGALAVVYGESGSGKSFFVLDLVAAVGRGVEWRGNRVTKGRVAYVVAEGAVGFQKRLEAYAQHHGIDLAGIDLFVMGDAPNLLQVDDVKELIKAIQVHGRCSIVVIDTFARVMAGANENSGEDVGKAIRHCEQITKFTGATVVLIHHSGKDATKGARGWSGLKAAADAEIEIVRADDDRVATITKLKDGEDGGEYGFALRTVLMGENEEGDPIESCWVDYTAAVPKAKKKSEPSGVWQKVVWRKAHDLAELGVDSATPTESLLTAAIESMAPEMDNRGQDRRKGNAKRALDALVAGGWLGVQSGMVVSVRLP